MSLAKYKNFVVANTVSACWLFFLLGLAAALLLPVDQTWWPFVLAIPALCAGLMWFFRKRVFWAALSGITALFASSLSLPFLSGDSTAYFVRCSEVSQCFTTKNVLDSDLKARVYPVFDPIKWHVWKFLAQGDDFRWLEQGTGFESSAPIIVHSPIERAMASLSSSQVDELTHRSVLRARIATVQLGAGEYGFRETRKPLLTWLTPKSRHAAGAFSGVGRSDEFMAIVEEAVRNDLKLRSLLDGRIGDVWRSTRRPAVGIREQVRNQWIYSSIFDRSFAGQIFGSERLQQIKIAGKPLTLMQQRGQVSDELFRASVFHYVTMMETPGGPRYRDRSDFYHKFDLEAFDETPIYRLFASTQGVGFDLTADSNRLAHNWRENRSKRSLTPIANKAHALELMSETPSFGSFSPVKFDEQVLEQKLTAVANDKGKLAEVMFAATRQIRFRLTNVAEMKERKFRISSSKKADYFASVAVVNSFLDDLDPPSREILVSQLDGLDQTLKRSDSLGKLVKEDSDYNNAELFKGTKKIGSGLFNFFLDYEVGKQLSYSSNEVDCSLSDARFASNFATDWLFFHSEKSQALSLALATRLWDTYGEGGRCPDFLPGLMMSHVLLNAQGDVRAIRTRRQLDVLLGRDSGWMRAAYGRIDRGELFEARSRVERMESAQ